MSNYRVNYILDIMVQTIRYKKNVEILLIYCIYTLPALSALTVVVVVVVVVVFYRWQGCKTDKLVADR